MFRLIGVIGLVALGITGVQAQTIPHTCKVFRESQQLITHIQSRILGGPLMIESCRTYENEHVAFLLYPPRKIRYDVCSSLHVSFTPTKFIENDPHNEPALEQSVFDYQPHTRFVWRFMAGDRPCPPQDDKGYVSTSGVTDGVFASIWQAWQAARASPSSFDAGFAHIPDVERQSPSYDRFRKLALDSSEPMKVDRVEVDDADHLHHDAYPYTDSPFLFVIRFVDPADNSKGFSLNLDIGPSGAEFWQFREWIS